MDEIEKNNARQRQSANSDNVTDRHRRRLLPIAAVGAFSAALSPEWRKPIINAVLLPAHAQTTLPPADPVWSLVDLRTILAVPSGEVVPVESFSRLELSACNLPPSTTMTVDVFAEIIPSGELQIVTGASVATGTGTISSFVNVDAGTVIVTAIVDAFRFEITVDGSTFIYTADAAAIGAAAAGTAVPASC